ncbi:imidazolonepropionase [Pedobacter faecalis]|uniref:imidazolonepropionase n=1 Tax=Pedobacter faecalis TaxID=3041495 RepID=UPI0025512893|nr:imidazolonepropionase [Pedobacter sp. ELA7]
MVTTPDKAMKLIGPFKQMLTLANLPLKGALLDDQLEIVPDGGVLVQNGRIVDVGHFQRLRLRYPDAAVEAVENPMVLLPGFVDCHTHLCFAGSRAKDYAMRISGRTYLEIAASGGGIWDSVTQTRGASAAELEQLICVRAARHFQEGVTTIEVKTGYGLNPDEEHRQLEAIHAASKRSVAELVPTCLAAHIKPKDFDGSASAYLEHVVRDLLPLVRQRNLASRVDIFVETGAFTPEEAASYLDQTIRMGFRHTVHADQFSVGGTAVAVKTGAVSADHLEACGDAEIALLAGSLTVAVALPGASLGLGMGYAPARKLLDAGAALAIASDWNPGSAPMGDLLAQAAVMGAAEKLTTAETFAGLTSRAAHALSLSDRGRIAPGQLADLQAYACDDYREILYHQGKLKPTCVWKSGNK